MADLNKLNSQISLKDVDVAQLTKALSEHHNTLIKLALVVGSLALAWVMYNGQHTKDQGMRIGMSQVREKLEMIKERDAAVLEFNTFKTSIPKKLTESELITLISNYAKLYHVTITSLSPAESKDMGIYDLIDVNFEAGSDDFKTMMLFMRKIEKSSFPLRINAWTGHEEENGKMTFNIEISAVLIHT